MSEQLVKPNVSMSGMSLPLLREQVNAMDFEDRKSVLAAMDAIWAETRKHGLEGVIALALLNGGMLHAISRDE